MTNQDVVKRVIAALEAKTQGRRFRCVICDNPVFRIEDAWAVVPSTEQIGEVNLNKVFPMAVLLCTNCGNSHLLNLITLGFSKDDFAEMRFSDDG